MTRELLFQTSFEPQLAAFAPWKSLVNIQRGASTPLAPSNYPGFEIIPGEAKYTRYDSFGHPTNGTQAFTLRVLFAHAQLAVAAMHAARSGDVSLLESFFAGGYLAPPVLPGDVARIDSVQIQSIDPATLDKTATRSTITVQAIYNFTIF